MGVFQCDVFQNNIFQGPCDAGAAPERRGGAFYPTPEELRHLQQSIERRDENIRAKDRALQREVERAYRKAHGIPEPVESEPEVLEEAVEEPPFFLDSGNIPDPIIRLPDPNLLSALQQAPVPRQPSEDEIMMAEVAQEWAAFQREFMGEDDDLDAGDPEEELRNDPMYKKLMMFLKLP
jgi:hypothetical protein